MPRATGDSSADFGKATAAALLLTAGAMASAPAEAKLPQIPPSRLEARAIGYCEFYDPNRPNEPTYQQLSPTGAINLFAERNNRAFVSDDQNDYSVVFKRLPKHGRIEIRGTGNSTEYLYIANQGYKGQDKYVANVKVGGVSFEVTGHIIPSSDHRTSGQVLCQRAGLPSYVWKISELGDANTLSTAQISLIGEQSQV